jgi:carboxylesterase
VSALHSLLIDGVSVVAKRYPSIKMPMLLLNSVNDHVVDPKQSDYLVEHYGGTVERVMLERSYHVATQDYDRQIVFDTSVAFVRRVTGS